MEITNIIYMMFCPAKPPPGMLRRPMEPNILRRRWQAGQAALGTFIFSTDPANVGVAALADLDIAVFDKDPRAARAFGSLPR